MSFQIFKFFLVPSFCLTFRHFFSQIPAPHVSNSRFMSKTGPCIILGPSDKFSTQPKIIWPPAGSKTYRMGPGLCMAHFYTKSSSLRLVEQVFERKNLIWVPLTYSDTLTHTWREDEDSCTGWFILTHGGTMTPFCEILSHIDTYSASKRRHLG